MAGQFYLQNDFSGGLADSVRVGMKGSLAEGVGLDIRSEPGILKVSQAMTLESGTIVDTFCKFRLLATDGNAYFFGDAGKVYKRTSAGVWTNPYTDANGTIVGCGEFNGNIYWATNTKLGQIATTNAASSGTWGGANNNFGTLTAATYHPMAVQGLFIFIGNARQVASVDDTGALTLGGTPSITLDSLPPNYQISAIDKFGIDIVVGASYSTTFPSARVLRWDTVSPSYIADDDIQEIGVNAFIPTDNYMFVQAGNQGRLYYYDGAKLSKKRKIRGDYKSKTMTMYPDSVSSFLGVPTFGISNLQGNPCLQGIYSYSQYDENYPLSLMLEYVPSQNKTGTMEIGGIAAVGTSLLVAFRNNATGSVGVDNIAWNTKYGSAYCTTLAIGGNRRAKKTFEENAVSYKSLPANTSIALGYYPNYSSSLTSITLKNETDYNKYFAQNKFEAGAVQFRLDFTASGNNAPEVEEIYSSWNNQETL